MNLRTELTHEVTGYVHRSETRATHVIKRLFIATMGTHQDNQFTSTRRQCSETTPLLSV